MKMQSATTTRWMNHLPPVLARVFAARSANSHQQAEIDEPKETEVVHNRWDQEKNGEPMTGARLGRPVRRPEIMVPVDFSPSSEEAAQYAIKVAKRAGARLVLLHAVHLNLTPYGPANPNWLRSGLCREALSKMEGIMAQAQHERVPVISVIEEGTPDNVIARAAKRWNVELIVLASRKRGKLARFFGQQILEKVTRRAECPVVVIQADAKKGVAV